MVSSTLCQLHVSLVESGSRLVCGSSGLIVALRWLLPRWWLQLNKSLLSRPGAASITDGIALTLSLGLHILSLGSSIQTRIY